MHRVPAILANRLQSLIYDDRAVAWVLIADDQTVVESGGHLDRYGLAGIRSGTPTSEQLYFLEGLLPLPESPFCLPSIELRDGCAADVHLHADGDATWMLLLDVTAERDAARRMQQKAYDMTLLEEKEAWLNRRLEAANAALTAAHRDLEASREVIRQELERKQVELAEARTLQLALAPPPFRGAIGNRLVSIDLVLEPAKEVGGDLVDYFCIGENPLILLLGDVSNKGAGAALMMARTHALFRGLISHPETQTLFRTPGEATTIVNTTLAAGNDSCMFVTLLVATFDAETGLLSYTRAGHVPPFLRRADGAIERLTAACGPPLGLVEDINYRSATVQLRPGDQLLIVTDGITEAADPSLALFGEQRIADSFAQRTSCGKNFLNRLLDQVRAFESGTPQSDDIAALVLRIETD